MQTTDAHWRAAAETLAARLAVAPDPGIKAWYRFGDAFLSIRTHDRSFLERFSLLFDGCAVEGPEVGHPLVEGTLTVDREGEGVLVSVQGCPVSDPVGFVDALFAEDGVRRSGSAGGWFGLGSHFDESWKMAVKGSDLVVTSDGPWPYVAGAAMVHRTMCAQADVLFVHAGAVELKGVGVLLVGPRESGKTTLSVGLAARGHGFLSDEVGAIRFEGPGVLAFPRAAGVRPGPRARAVEPIFETPDLPVEQFADGSTKTLLTAETFGVVPPGHPIPLRHVIVLDGRGDKARLTRMTPDARHVQFLAPVRSMPFSDGFGSKMLRLIKMVPAVNWHRLTAGTPDETITLIERRLGGT